MTRVVDVFMFLHGTRRNNRVEKTKANSWPLSFHMSVPDCLGIEAESCLIVLFEELELNVC